MFLARTAFMFGLIQSQVRGMERSHATSDIGSRPWTLVLPQSTGFAFSTIRCL
jgi:hypothetical protein